MSAQFPQSILLNMGLQTECKPISSFFSLLKEGIGNKAEQLSGLFEEPGFQISAQIETEDTGCSCRGDKDTGHFHLCVLGGRGVTSDSRAIARYLDEDTSCSCGICQRATRACVELSRRSEELYLELILSSWCSATLFYCYVMKLQQTEILL